jgi:SAM-dependent methyltransferase
VQAGSFWYASCDRCGLLRLDPLPDMSAVAALYDANYFSAASSGGYVDYLGDEVVHRRNARRHLRRLHGFGPPGTLVEIGSAAGFLLDEARQAGWEVRGVEISKAMTEEAKQRFGLHLVDSIFQIDLPESSVDVVLANQVVEHLIDPLETLNAARKLLRPGGLLVVETWDKGSLLARVMRSKWQQITPPSVVWLWDRSQLEALIGRAGFHQVSVKVSMKWVSLRTVFGQLGTTRVAKHPVGRLAIPYALGDLVILAARA